MLLYYELTPKNVPFYGSLKVENVWDQEQFKIPMD